MTAKEYLDHIKRCYQTMQALYDRLVEVRTKIEGLKAITYDRERVQVSPSNKTEELIAQLVDTEDKLSKEVREHFDEVVEATKRIYSLDNERQIQVLEMRYIKGMRWQVIADELDIEYRSATRLHRKALRNFERKYQGVLEVSL